MLTCSFFLCFSRSFFSFSFSFLDFTLPPSSASSSGSAFLGAGAALPFLGFPAKTSSSSSNVPSSGALLAKSTTASPLVSACVGSSPSTKSLSTALPFLAFFDRFFFNAAKSPPPPIWSSSPLASASPFSSAATSAAGAAADSPSSASQSSSFLLFPFFLGAIFDLICDVV